MSFSKAVALIIIVALASYALLLYSKPNIIPALPERKTVSIATPIPEAQTKFYFSPVFLKLLSAVPQEVSIMVDTGQNTITQAQIEIQYNPQVITITSVRSGTFFSNTTPLVNKNDVRRGRIEFAVGLADNQSPVKGVGSLATLTFVPGPQATLSGRTRLTFLPKSSVRGKDQPLSLLSATEDLSIDLRALIPTVQPQL